MHTYIHTYRYIYVHVFLNPRSHIFTFRMLHLGCRGPSDVLSVFVLPRIPLADLSGYLGPASTVCIVNNMTCEARPTTKMPKKNRKCESRYVLKAVGKTCSKHLANI